MIPTRLLIVDTETGGTDALRHAIIQIGAVMWEHDQGVGRIIPNSEFSIVIHESGELDPEALAINHFTDERIAREGVSSYQALVQWHRYLEPWTGIAARNDTGASKLVLGGHNIGFDSEFLRRLYRINGYTKADFERRISYRQFDTASVARFLIMAGVVPIQEPKSDSLFMHFGCTPDKPHDALSDAIATANLLSRMLALTTGLRRPGFTNPFHDGTA